MNHKMTYGTVMKRHLRPHCQLFKRTGGNAHAFLRPWKDSFQ